MHSMMRLHSFVLLMMRMVMIPNIMVIIMLCPVPISSAFTTTLPTSTSTITTSASSSTITTRNRMMIGLLRLPSSVHVLFSTSKNIPNSSPKRSPKRSIYNTDCDDENTPPSLQTILSSIHAIKSGTDIRGTFIDHPRVGSVLNVSSAITTRTSSSSSCSGGLRAITPFAAFCYGAAFANMVQIRSGKGSAVLSLSNSSNFINNISNIAGDTLLTSEEEDSNSNSNKPTTTSTINYTNICIGRDPRSSGVRLADAFCRGVESITGVRALYTNLATTPSMFAFCRSHVLDCDGAVMVTASHLPEDRNGFKFFTRNNGGLNKHDIEALADSACTIARSWYDLGIIPPTPSGYDSVSCSQFVDYMPFYIQSLKKAIHAEVSSGSDLPLKGLKIVLNAGNGAGYFFNQVLSDCGADVTNSIHLTPDGTFQTKTGVPNPEYKPMMEETIDACQRCDADIGIMLDTDADRCGFVVPRISSIDGSSSCVVSYDALNRNRLIALLGVIFSTTSPGCTFVTDSVTSEGLSIFLKDLGIYHVRYLKGYANVIGKAKELTESGRALAEVAIETSGHCAMRENGFLDDGTYTAVKIVGLLARMMKQKKNKEKGEDSNNNNNDDDDDEKKISLFDLISDMEEMDEVVELRLGVMDESIETTKRNFELLRLMIENECEGRNDWTLDEENLEGVRVRLVGDNGVGGSTGSNGCGGGGFFMLRMSLHDPILSLQIEGENKEKVNKMVVEPLLQLIEECEGIIRLDIDSLKKYYF